MSDDFEQDLFLSEFVHECREATELAVQDVLSLEQVRDQDSIDRIFRVLHSVKGNSSMMGFMELSGFVHKVEDACSDIRSGKREPDKKVIDILLKSFDLIDEVFSYIIDKGDDKIDYNQGYDRLKKLDAALEVPESCLSPAPVSVESAPLESEVAAPEVKPAVVPVEEPLQASAVGGQVRKNPTALIVDDDFASRKVLSHYLSKFMPCYVAKDGGEAIQAFTGSLAEDTPRFDLIVLDIMMPNIDGLQACKAIRQMERSTNMDTFGEEAKIFIASSLSDEKTIHKALYDCQADTYLIKPVMLKKLHRQLVRFKLIEDE
ncbi:response regulator [Desulfovibrio sp. JC022]|uniref:ATP-binding response regulator n=1 Tax=Desulfovibrio sp. JC022 TaxID=2593642 RepID=UPI0013D673E8|nr:response regulator [Desulfovibrio sp. JC022]NDV23281.1 response regulator [Desulfovibrio sp. JC022]